MTQTRPSSESAPLPRPPHLLVGTSGFSYAEWKGSFYPEDLPGKRMLGHYASRLPAVEINNTFYRLPRASMLEGWAAQVPEGFRFAIKASRRITHIKRLKDADDEIGYLFHTLDSLAGRLGCVLFQLPPTLKADAERLERFLDLIPSHVRTALEFRHESWLEPALVERLRTRQVALVWMDEGEGEPRGLERTAPHAYLRLRGERYTAEELAVWLARLREQRFEEAFVFFKHEDAAAGPALAQQLLALAARTRDDSLPAHEARSPARQRAG